MRRPSAVRALGAAGVLAGAGGAAVVFGQSELAGQKGVDVWSNVWMKIGVGLVAGAVAIAVLYLLSDVLGRGNRQDDGSPEQQADRVRSGDEAEGPAAAAVRRHATDDAQARPPGPSSAVRPNRIPTTTTASTAGSPDRDATGTGQRLIEERLDLVLADGGIHSKRKTPDQPHDFVQVALPSDQAVADYRSALAKAATLGDRPDDATVRWIRELVRPLQEALVSAIPLSARRRMTGQGRGEPRSLVALELTLTDSRLERYPWELIADPAVLGGGTMDVTVWRSLLSALDPPVQKRWTSCLLLAGMAAVLKAAPLAHDELAWIKAELSDHSHLHVYDCAGIPPRFQPLLARYHPAAFHLVAQAANDGFRPLGERGPTLEELSIRPDSIATDLAGSGVWVAMFNCCDSATAPSSGDRPPAYEIAWRSGAATIGMAGLMPPYLGGLFATTFYRCLAHGSSAVQAYHHAVRAIRDHEIYSTMWSIPVMYARNSKVIPFPVDELARARLGLEQVRVHIRTLDSELNGLAYANFQSPAEWAAHAAIPIERTQCISGYLTATAVPGPADTAAARRRQDSMDAARNDLRSALSATVIVLSQLGDPALGAAERRGVLQELPLHREQQQRILVALDELFEEVG
jgi:hypothetical protein